jgi:hypothetical protein
MTLEEYTHSSFEIAFKALSDGGYKGWRGQVCLDTVKESFNQGLTIEEAADRMVDDSLYWDGCYC